MTEITITKDMIEYPIDYYSDDPPYVVTLASGERYKIEFENDFDSNVTDADCYNRDDIESWSNDQWYFAGVIVTPLDVPESVQFQLSDSLWGLEFDFPLDPPQEHNGRTFRYTDADYIIMHGQIPEMIEQVQAKVKEWDLEQAIQSFIYG